jgi:probable O-glycosylation ligase (exosortase A-associated)
MMRDNSESLDYEPLTRPRQRPTAVADGDEGFAKPKAWAAEEPARRSVFKEEPPPANEVFPSHPEVLEPLKQTNFEATFNETSPKPAPTKAETDNSTFKLLKRGHALSYLGVFLFSLMLYFRPYEWSTSLAWLSSTAFWIAVATVAIFIPTQLGLEGNFTVRTPEVRFVLVLLLFAIISIPLSLSPDAGLTSLSDYAKVVLIFIVMVNVVRSEFRLKALLLLTFVASAIVSVSAMNDYLSGNLTLAGTRITGSIGGIFSNPNDLALHLVTMTPLALALALGTSNLLKKLFYVGAALIFIVGIVATSSRGGVLGLVAALLVLSLKMVRRMRVPVVVAVLVLMLGALAVAPGAFRERIFTTGDASAVSRTDDLKRSIFLAARHPLLGVGFGNYVFYSNQAKATHNAYTQVASELGLIAAVFYVLFIVWPLKSLLKIERETRDDHKERTRKSTYFLVLGLQASLIGYMVSSFFASVPYFWYVYYLVAYSIAVRRIYDSRKLA